MTGPIRAIVVDDQPLARERLVHLLAAEPDVDVVDVCATGLEAVASIVERRPDLVFLDMQMPELDGLAVIARVGPDRMPLTVFVTAYDSYAVQAFESQALDYLLKPFARPRFERALDRARHALARRREADTASALMGLVAQMRQRTPSPPARLVVKSGGRVSFVDRDAIDWAEAEGNYVRLHAGPERYVVRETMNALIGQLGDDHFVRVHRSAIVNLRRVREIRIGAGGDYDAVLTTGARVPVSRASREALQTRMASMLNR